MILLGSKTEPVFITTWRNSLIGITEDQRMCVIILFDWSFAYRGNIKRRRMRQLENQLRVFL